jgi:PAS domain S-box-containing protein
MSFRGLFDASIDGIVIADAESRELLMANAAICRMLGYDEHELVGQPIDVIHPEEELVEICRAFDRQVRGETPVLSDMPICRRDGLLLYVDIGAALVELDGRRCLMSTYREVTDRRLAEQELLRQHGLIVAIMETSPVGIVVFDREGQLAFVNSAAERILGVDREGIGTRSHDAPEWKITDYDGGPFPDERLPFRVVMSTGRAVEGVRHAIERSDGERVLLYVNASPLVDADGDVGGVVAALLDVTSSVQAEVRFRSIVEGSPMGMHMYRLETDGSLVFAGANQAADRILGVDNRQYIGKTLEQAFPPLAVTDIPEHYRQVARTGVPWHDEQVEYRDETISGAFDVHVFATGPGRIAVMFLDITDRKRVESEVLRLNRELERRVSHRTAQLEAVNRELESFCYSVSHDLRTPLRSMDGFSQILMDDYGDRLDADGQLLLQRIRAGSQRMGRLIDDLLELSRVARLDLRRLPVDLSLVAREVIDELRLLEPSRSVAVEVEDGLVANGDPNLLRVVLHNLLGNAWKFTGPQQSPRVSFGRAEGDGVVFVVRDNGVGFDPRFADKLFHPFQRLHGAADFEGAGVGLATVQRIIARHGGRVWAEAQAGAGASFFFTVEEG